MIVPKTISAARAIPASASVERPLPLVPVGIFTGAAVAADDVAVDATFEDDVAPVSPVNGVAAGAPTGSVSTPTRASAAADARTPSDLRLMAPNISADGP